MKIKGNLREENINFVNSTKKQSKYFKTNIFLIVSIEALFLFFVFLNITQGSICTITSIIICLFV